jgi:hypothetical protein
MIPIRKGSATVRRPPLAPYARNRRLGIAALCVGLTGCINHNSGSDQMYNPREEGFVPDSATAISLAETLLASSQPDLLRTVRPLSAGEQNGTWVVRARGTGGAVGEPVLEIRRADAAMRRTGVGAPDISSPTSREILPNRETAARIAEVLLVRVYGRRQIDRQLPLDMAPEAQGWVATGRLKPTQVGGVAVVELARSDGRVVRMTHGR